MQVILTSTNKAKLTAAERVFNRHLPNSEIVAVKCDSEVSPTPTSDEEAIAGCLTRISNARRRANTSSVIIALEGLVARNSFGSFIYGWCVMEWQSSGITGYGCSGRVQLPNSLAERLDRTKEFSEVAQEFYSLRGGEETASLGTNGIITSGLYTRVDEFEDALTCALGFCLNPTNHASSSKHSTIIPSWRRAR